MFSPLFPLVGNSFFSMLSSTSFFLFFFNYLEHFSITFSVYFHYTHVWKVNRMKNWKYKHKETKGKKNLVRLPMRKDRQGNLRREVNNMSQRPRIWGNVFKCLSLQSISKSSILFQQFLTIHRKCHHLDLQPGSIL